MQIISELQRTTSKLFMSKPISKILGNFGNTGVPTDILSTPKNNSIRSPTNNMYSKQPVFLKFPSIFYIGFNMNSLDVVLCSSEIVHLTHTRTKKQHEILSTLVFCAQQKIGMIQWQHTIYSILWIIYTTTVIMPETLQPHKKRLCTLFKNCRELHPNYSFQSLYQRY